MIRTFEELLLGSKVWVSLALRGALTLSGTIGLLLVVAGFMMRRRDREQAELPISAGG